MHAILGVWQMREIIERIWPLSSRQLIGKAIHEVRRRARLPTATEEEPLSPSYGQLYGNLLPCLIWQVRAEFADHEGKLDLPNFLDALLMLLEFFKTNHVDAARPSDVSPSNITVSVSPSKSGSRFFGGSKKEANKAA